MKIGIMAVRRMLRTSNLLTIKNKSILIPLGCGRWGGFIWFPFCRGLCFFFSSVPEPKLRGCCLVPLVMWTQVSGELGDGCPAGAVSLHQWCCVESPSSASPALFCCWGWQVAWCIHHRSTGIRAQISSRLELLHKVWGGSSGCWRWTRHSGCCPHFQSCLGSRAGQGNMAFGVAGGGEPPLLLAWLFLRNLSGHVWGWGACSSPLPLHGIS